jgi:hypothetical protein
MDQYVASNERRQYGEKFRGHTAVEKKCWRQLLEQRFPRAIAGVLSCYDRLMLQGTLPNICFAGGMEQYLRRYGIAYKDIPSGRCHWPTRSSVVPKLSPPPKAFRSSACAKRCARKIICSNSWRNGETGPA